jgi:sec-independent protein translocase protein TatC
MSDPNKPSTPSSDPDSEETSKQSAESEEVSGPSPYESAPESGSPEPDDSSEQPLDPEGAEEQDVDSVEADDQSSKTEGEAEQPPEEPEIPEPAELAEEGEEEPAPGVEDAAALSTATQSAGDKPPTKPRRQSLLEEEDGEAELGGRMTFLEHLDEFRKRIMRSVIAVVVTFCVAWIFREQIYGFLAVPIHEVVDKLVVIKPTEPFTIYLKVSFTAAIFMAAPFILSQVWMFIAPGLYRKEKIYALPFLFFSTLLFILGGVFAYYVILPPALNFLLLEFGREFQPMISAVEFFDFELLIIIGMGAIFQLPILVAFLSIFGLVTPGFLWRNFRYAFLIITIIAAVVSPTTDPFNLFLWSGPMVILYGISIGISWIFQIRRKRAKKREQEAGG